MRVRQPVPAASPITDEFGNVRDDNFLYMNGPGTVELHVAGGVPIGVGAARKSGLTIGQIDLLCFTNRTSICSKRCARRSRFRRERFCEHYSHCGNTVSATIPIALYHAHQQGRISAGRRLLLAGFGGGYSWAGRVLVSVGPPSF